MKVSKIYVIDDSPLVCFAVKRVLAPRGFDVVSERSGRTAIAELPSLRPDLVICDLILPDIGGLEVCQFIHRDPRLSATPVLVLSGAVNDEVRARAKEYGVREVFTKPLVGDELVECVARILATSEPVAGEPKIPPRSGERSARVLAAIGHAFARPGMVKGIRYGFVLRTGGEVVLGTPPQGVADASEKFFRLGRLAASVSSLAGHKALEGLILESEAGTLLLHPMDEGLTVVLVLRKTDALGMARYFVRRLRKALADLEN